MEPKIEKTGFDPKNRKVELISEKNDDDGKTYYHVEKKETGFVSKKWKSKPYTERCFNQQVSCSQNQ